MARQQQQTQPQHACTCGAAHVHTDPNEFHRKKWVRVLLGLLIVAEACLILCITVSIVFEDHYSYSGFGGLVTRLLAASYGLTSLYATLVWVICIYYNYKLPCTNRFLITTLVKDFGPTLGFIFGLFYSIVLAIYPPFFYRPPGFQWIWPVLLMLIGFLGFATTFIFVIRRSKDRIFSLLQIGAPCDEDQAFSDVDIHTPVEGAGPSERTPLLGSDQAV